jgi:hypothetical protein
MSRNTSSQTLGYTSNRNNFKLLFGVEISRLQRKEKCFKNTKSTAIRPENGKLSAIIFVVLNISLLAKVLNFYTK